MYTSLLVAVFVGLATGWFIRALLRMTLISPYNSAQDICKTSQGFYPNTEQCDLYYTCEDFVPTEKLCPDGLVFDETSNKHEKCDYIYNVDCGDRLKLQAPKATEDCPRQNGLFAHKDPTRCHQGVICKNGIVEQTIDCPAGLVFAEFEGTCVWATEADKAACEDRTKTESGFVCPDPTQFGQEVNGLLVPNPTYPHPDDCRLFYVCLLGSTPQLSGCPGGQVFNDATLFCDDPENVPDCVESGDGSSRRRRR